MFTLLSGSAAEGRRFCLGVVLWIATRIVVTALMLVVGAAMLAVELRADSPAAPRTPFRGDHSAAERLPSGGHGASQTALTWASYHVNLVTIVTARDSATLNRRFLD
ncbi:hypothetical protein KGA66_22555 [Actinocrinis puniceicyclus]|uniref:Uncharacterized protein n=1 Tax=Actinocrinis puniceicyclus TaxID=977794 RepID=A0A8J7WU83_9ACTN|nr:hypothetical protein [Actinocrinis puniceicyclus]MBS2965850.1 hypothetical protein [Actinocrinis puniceicyclus]